MIFDRKMSGVLSKTKLIEVLKKLCPRNHDYIVEAEGNEIRIRISQNYFIEQFGDVLKSKKGFDPASLQNKPYNNAQSKAKTATPSSFVVNLKKYYADGTESELLQDKIYFENEEEARDLVAAWVMKQCALESDRIEKIFLQIGWREFWLDQPEIAGVADLPMF